MNSDLIDEIRKTLEQHEKRISVLESIIQAKPKRTNKELSMNEFFLDKKPRTDADKTLVIGYYLEQYRDLTSFNVDDLEEGFREIKEPVPKNVNLAVIHNIKKGYMMEANQKKNDKKAWTLTNSGVRFVEDGLKREKK